MIKVCTPFSYSLVNVETVSNFWIPHDVILRISFEHVTQQQFGQNRRLKFLEHVDITLTRQDGDRRA